MFKDENVKVFSFFFLVLRGIQKMRKIKTVIDDNEEWSEIWYFNIYSAQS